MAECTEIVPYQPPDLNSRLKEEHEMLEKYFWPEKFPILYTVNNEPCFERNVKLKDDRNYRLRVSVRSDYPVSLPDLVVCKSPEPMLDGPGWNGSHSTHTWQRKDGFLHICHWHPVCWTSENMIYQVFNKGEEWLEAYEKFLVTKTLPLELEQMQLTEEEKVTDQQRTAALIQQQLAMQICLNPNFVNELHRFHLFAINMDILAHRLPITDDEIRLNAQQRMLASALQTLNEDPAAACLAELFRLECAITECQLDNPGCDVNVSFTQIQDDRLTLTLHLQDLVAYKMANPCSM